MKKPEFCGIPEPMSDEQIAIFADTAANFQEALETLPQSHPIRVQIEKSQDDHRRTHLAGERIANELAHQLIT